MKKVLELLNGIKDRPILCLGDIMLDRYIYGRADRISPEAPVPIVRVTKRMTMPGGVGNVAKNIGFLGACPQTISLTGDDAVADILINLFKEAHLPIPIFIRDQSRSTSVKTRVIAGIQQLLRFDDENDHPISSHTAQKLLAAVKKTLPKIQAIVLSDYGKGTLSEGLIQEVISLAQKNGRPVVVDPKGLDYRRYHGANLVTPNRNELSEAAGRKVTTTSELKKVGREIMNTCGLSALLITRGEDGMLLLTNSGANPILMPSQAREVFDVSGAGDTVVAVMVSTLALGAPLALGASLANLAAGVVVGKVGTAVATPEEIKAWAEKR